MNYTAEIYTIKNPSNSLRAYASLVIEVNNTTQMKIKGFKVFEGVNGLFVKPPQTKGKDKEGGDTWYDDVQFVDTTKENTFREEMYQTIISEYSKKAGSNYKNDAASSQSSYSNQTKQKTKPLW